MNYPDKTFFFTRVLPILCAAPMAACSGSSDEGEAPGTSAAPTSAQVIQDMLAAMGGTEALRNVDNLTLRGGGFRRHVGQIPATGGEDPVADLESLTEITEGGRTLALYERFGIPHVSPMVLPFVADAGVLFQSDLFFGAGASPDTVALYEAIADLDLEVNQIAGGHGGVFPYSALAEAVEGN